MKLFFLILSSIFILSSCGSSYENMLRKNTSEVRRYYLDGSNENINCTLIMGERESNYMVNGYSTDCVQFGVLTFDIKDTQLNKSTAKYKLTVGTDIFSGDLQENPFDHTLVADIKKIVDANKKIVATIMADGFESKIELNYINKGWKTDSDTIYSLLVKKYKKELKTFVNKKDFEGEVYIKIINDADINVNDYMWFVNIIGRHGNRMSIIVSPKTNEVLAENIYL